MKRNDEDCDQPTKPILAPIAGNRLEMEREAEGADYLELLRAAQSLEPALQGLRSWADVATAIALTAFECALRVKALATVLRLHLEKRSRQSTTVLLLLTWHALVASHRIARHWNGDCQDAWQNALFQMLRALNECDPDDLTTYGLQVLAQRTLNRLRKHSQRTWRIAAADHRYVSDLCDDQFLIFHDGFDRVDNADEIQYVLAELNRRVESGAMRAMDRDMIRATRFHEIPLRVYADELAISYETAKKRRQRAEKTLREELQKVL